MSDPHEVELKLDIDPADLPAVGRLPLLADGDAEKARLVSVYYDTPDDALSARGYSLRVRRNGDRRVQTLKAEGESASGLFVRPEWECDIAGDTPVLDAAGSPLAGLVPDGALDRLTPRFTVTLERITRTLATGGATIELAIDQGEVRAGSAAAPVSEVEAELKSGDIAALFELARAIDGVVPVRIGVVTKAERGARLLSGIDVKPAKAEPVALVPDMTTAAAFQAIARSCLRQFRLNEPLIARPAPATALHQARVGLRRLRSALSLFRPMLSDDPRYQSLGGELRWLSALLGEARNVDVLVEGGASDAALQAALQAARRARYAAVADALASSRVRGLMLDLTEWLALGAWRREDDAGAMANQPIGTVAPALLDRARRRLKRHGRRLAELDDDRRHAIRIDAKKLRYAAEFFARLYQGKKADRRRELFLAALEALQDNLGHLNDQATATTLLREIGLNHRDVAAHAERLGVNRAKLLSRAESAHDTLLDTKRFWRT